MNNLLLKLKTYNYSFVFTIVVFLGLILFQYALPIQNHFLSDPLVKAVMIDSIRKNDFKSENVIYNGDNWDSSFKLHPLNEGFIFSNRDRFIGQYPVAFTYIYSLLPLDIEYLALVNFFLIFLLILIGIRSFPEILKIKILAGGFLFSVLMPLCFELSEYPLYLFLSGIGIFLFFRDWSDQSLTYKIQLGSFLLGLSLWFRLESILFAIPLFLFYFLDCIKSYSLRFAINRTLLVGIFFLFPLVLFLIFNSMNYGHILGPRYIVNVENSHTTVIERINRFFSILFTNWENNLPKLGFFFISPLLLYHIISELRFFKLIPKIRKYLILISISYLLLVGLLSPNDGITITGRYACLAVFPLLISMGLKYKSKDYRFFEIFLLVWSIFIWCIILLIIRFSVKQILPYHLYFDNWKDKVVFATDDISSSSLGLKLRDNIVFAIRRENNLDRYQTVINKMNPDEFNMIMIPNEANFSNQKNVWLKMNDIALYEGYTCKSIETSLLLEHFICKK